MLGFSMFESRVSTLVSRQAVPCSGLWVLAAIFLSACGGGGSTGGTYVTSEYAASSGLSQIGAAEAYALTAAGREGGAGRTIGIIDDGVDSSHEDLDRPLSLGGRFDMNPDADGGSAHGTRVAGVAVAERNGRGTMGVAFNAGLVDYDAGTGDDSILASDATNALWQAADTALPSEGHADVINMSFGSQNAYAPMLAAMQHAARSGIAMVVATGNDGGANPSFPAAHVTNEFVAGMGIAVAAGSPSGLADYSNVCGAAHEYCLVAPGRTRTTSAGTIDGIVSVQGTSFAAPHVAGAFAVLSAAFPNLTASEIIDRMLSTADPVPGCAEKVCGRGFLNVERALEALGEISVAGAAPEAGSVPAAAFGSGGSVSTAALKSSLSQVVLVDESGAAFYADLSSGVESGRASDIGSLMRIDNAWMFGPADWVSR